MFVCSIYSNVCVWGGTERMENMFVCPSVAAVNPVTLVIIEENIFLILKISRNALKQLSRYYNLVKCEYKKGVK